MQAAGFGNLGIIDRDRGTGHDHVRAGNVGGRVPFESGRSQSGETLRHRGIFQVGAGNPVAKIQQYLGNPAHADAADAYEMNALNFGEHGKSVSDAR